MENNNFEQNNNFGENPFEKKSIADNLKAPAESLKQAGISARDGIDEFATRFQEDRKATTPAAAYSGASNESTGNFVERTTELVRDVAGSVKRAADGTKQTPAFTEAKEKFSTAFTETKQGVAASFSEAKGTAQQKAEEAKVTAKQKAEQAKGTAQQKAEDFKSSKSSDAANPTTPNENKGDIIDGEVMSSDE